MNAEDLLPALEEFKPLPSSLMMAPDATTTREYVWNMDIIKLTREEEACMIANGVKFLLKVTMKPMFVSQKGIKDLGGHNAVDYAMHHILSCHFIARDKVQKFPN